MLDVVKTHGIVVRPSLYCVNTSHLKDKILHEKLTKLWEGIHMQAQLDEADIEKIFLKGLFESKRITRTFGKDKAKQRKEKQWTL